MKKSLKQKVGKEIPWDKQTVDWNVLFNGTKIFFCAISFWELKKWGFVGCLFEWKIEGGSGQ